MLAYISSRNGPIFSSENLGELIWHIAIIVALVVCVMAVLKWMGAAEPLVTIIRVLTGLLILGLILDMFF